MRVHYINKIENLIDYKYLHPHASTDMCRPSSELAVYALQSLGDISNVTFKGHHVIRIVGT